MLRRMNRPFPVGSESKVASRSLSLLPKAAACCRTYPTAYPWAQLNDQECQRVIRIVAVLRQERSTQVALHGNELKWWLALMILQPTCPAAAEIAQPIKNNYSVFHFPNLPERTVASGSIKSASERGRRVTIGLVVRLTLGLRKSPSSPLVASRTLLEIGYTKCSVQRKRPRSKKNGSWRPRDSRSRATTVEPVQSPSVRRSLKAGDLWFAQVGARRSTPDPSTTVRLHRRTLTPRQRY
jgi:hypothetical protein